MSRLENLRRSRESYIVKYREFLRISSSRPDAHVVFFEGQDSKYYSSRIEILRPDVAWDGINTGGKENVLKLYNLITNNSQHGTANSIYFIDRDFDELSALPQDRRVYITPGYSIENLYVTEAAFRRILKHEFSLDEYSQADDTFARCVSAFSMTFRSFLEHTAELNGWIMVQRARESVSPGCARLNLNSINLSKLVAIDLNATVKCYTLHELEKVTGATFQVTAFEVQAACGSIPLESAASRFRGKFQAYFLRAFLTKLIQDASSDQPKLFTDKRRISLHISEKNFLSELAQYAETPECLRNFLCNITTTKAQQ